MIIGHFKKCCLFKAKHLITTYNTIITERMNTASFLMFKCPLPSQLHMNIQKASSVMQDEYSLHNIVPVSKLFIIEAKLLNKIGRHLLHLIIRKGLAKPRTSDNDIVLALHKAGYYVQYRKM